MQSPDVAAVRMILAEFRAQGHATVFLATCCGRTSISTFEPKSCRSCPNIPVARIVPTDGTYQPEEDPCPPTP